MHIKFSVECLGWGVLWINRGEFDLGHIGGGGGGRIVGLATLWRQVFFYDG